MAKIETAVNGTFCWVEGSVEDPKAAEAFYAAVFAWTFDPMPMPAGSYAMAKLGGAMVGGVTNLPAEAKAMGARSHWLSYVACEDTDATTEKARQLGAKVLAGPMDMGPGRMSLLQDPSGGVFALWHAKQSMGPSVRGEVGATCWNELVTSNVDAAGKFYASLFGWQPETMNMGSMQYTVFKSGGTQVGGMMAMPKDMQGAPTMWNVYFQVADADATIAHVQKLGGRALSPTMDVPTVGRFATLMDPQGTVFSVLQAPKG